MPYKDKDKAKANRRKYNEANKEELFKRRKKYREANKEKINKYRKKYKESNKEKIIESSKRYYESNKEKIIESSKRYDKANVVDLKVPYIKKSLKRKNLPITPESMELQRDLIKIFRLRKEFKKITHKNKTT